MQEQDYVISNEYDGKVRKLYRYQCQNPGCGKWFRAPQHTHAKYCSRECSARVKTLKNTTVVQCQHCGRYVEKRNSVIKHSKSNIFFCNKYCKDQAHIRDGDNNYRNRAFYYYGKQCKVCEYGSRYGEDERLLDVHHIDGNRANNKVENLQVLCVMHHAMITRGIVDKFD